MSKQRGVKQTVTIECFYENDALKDDYEIDRLTQKKLNEIAESLTEQITDDFSYWLHRTGKYGNITVSCDSGKEIFTKKINDPYDISQ